MLLKVTHAPIVGAIYIFERAYDKISAGANTFSSVGPGITDLSIDTDPNGHKTAKKQRPFLSNRKSTKNSSHHVPEESSSSPIQHNEVFIAKGKKNEDGHLVAVVDNSAMEEKVRDLSKEVKDLSQTIKELTALLMAQQSASATEDS